MSLLMPSFLASLSMPLTLYLRRQKHHGYFGSFHDFVYDVDAPSTFFSLLKIVSPKTAQSLFLLLLNYLALATHCASNTPRSSIHVFDFVFVAVLDSLQLLIHKS